MLIDTQISSFPIPAEIWFKGYDGLPSLPPLYLSGRDALAIERRSIKGVNLRNEMRRYTLCCQRMQGIVHEIAHQSGVLPQPIKWPSQNQDDSNLPSARAYLAIMALMGRWMFKFLSDSPPEQLELLYPRVSSVFFPPEDAERHLKCFEFIATHPQVDLLFERAARESTLPICDSSISVVNCRKAFHMRHESLKFIALRGYGLVDVLEIV